MTSPPALARVAEAQSYEEAVTLAAVAAERRD
jgi:hypothetical protein